MPQKTVVSGLTSFHARRTVLLTPSHIQILGPLGGVWLYTCVMQELELLNAGGGGGVIGETIVVRVEVGQGQPLEATLDKVGGYVLGLCPRGPRKDQRLLLSSRRVSQSRNRTPSPPSSPGSTRWEQAPLTSLLSYMPTSTLRTSSRTRFWQSQFPGCCRNACCGLLAHGPLESNTRFESIPTLSRKLADLSRSICSHLLLSTCNCAYLP